MSKRLKLEIRQREIRAKLAEISAKEKATDEDRASMRELTSESIRNDEELNALAVSEDVTEVRETAEEREVRELRSSVRLGNYIQAAIGHRTVDGRESEYNAALSLPDGHVPLELFAPPETEIRQTTDTDTTVQPRTWVDRLFANTAASALGLTMESVGAGVSSHPITKTGGTSVQRGREEVVDASSWTVGVEEIRPTRQSVGYEFSIEDSARLPGLEAALRRDMSMALSEKLDRTIFVGDDGANENSADVPAITATAGIAAQTITQDAKVKGPETLAAFTGLLDGFHAESLGDLNVVAFVGANQLWCSTNIAGASAQPVTMKKWLSDAGLEWRTRGGIEAATGAGKLAAMIGLGRGLPGAGVVATWSGAQLIHDPYSGARKGQVQLTLHSLWNYRIVRPTNFAKVDFVA